MNLEAKKKALLVAVQYQELSCRPGYSDAALRGTSHDPGALEKLLVNTYKWKKEDIRVMTDSEPPTKDNILTAMKKLVKGARSGDTFFFLFSGHGSQVKNRNGAELDGFDEVIWPADVRFNDQLTWEDPGDPTENFIIDDEIHNILVEHLPKGSRMVMLFDHCHSGTAADLPIEVDAERNDSCIDSAKSITSITTKQFVDKEVRTLRHTVEHDPRAATATGQPIHQAPSSRSSKALATQGLEAIVESWSACRDSEVTFGIDDQSSLLVKAFCDVLAKEPHPTHSKLLVDINRHIVERAQMNSHVQGMTNPEHQVNMVLGDKGVHPEGYR
ncbi:hypothetical protein CERSUDRAFT_98532 [Gelatoporia subvermispora B]|uniref:Peptidase C14 caspase domain-containing protein n=1 Tax=Ceriporiopsis subvermispora (strain B) TaxID=914234 RepID=M2R3E7_CERS8|nr:hypothetical protein CERSUDRAFT_98532 [Gelatoporia subvermispora B]